MDLEVDEALAILERTPATLRALLTGLSPGWVESNEGGESWSPYDVVGHLIHGERTDWIARARIILEHGEARPFDPFDRFAQFEASRGLTLVELLDQFERLRRDNLETLRGMNLGEAELARGGLHPELGPVTMSQLIATWAVHDLGHIAQISRVMAKQYGEAVGPWRAYLPVLDDRPQSG